MRQIGGLLGWLIVVCYGLTVLNFVLKAINKKYSKEISKSPNFRKYYNIIMKFIVKNHKLFGGLTVVLIISHFIIQFSRRGLNITGAVAATVMILQILLGMYGAYINKKRSGLWFNAHRIIAVVLAFTILIHIL